MAQLGTLIWLKWTLFKNSFRSTKTAVNRIASALGMLIALAVGLAIALGLGAASYAITKPGGLLEELDRRSSFPIDVAISGEFIFFTVFAFVFLIWSTIPLSTGSGRQFDPGNMLMYPIS